MSKSTSKLFETESNISDDVKITEDEVVEEKRESESVENEISADSEESDYTNTVDDIQDIQINAVVKKRFRINGDNSKIIELDTADIGISYRLTEAYKRLNNLMDEVSKQLEGKDLSDEDDETVIEITEKLRELDDAMKNEIDYIFNSEVADKCSNGSSMYKPYEGMFVYEHIIDVITGLYATDLNREFNAMKRRVNARTEQYTKGKSPTKKYARH